MSEESLVTIVIAVVGSAALPALINKIKPKSELDAFNMAKTMELYERLERKYDEINTKYDELEKKYSKVNKDYDELEERYISLKRDFHLLEIENERLKKGE